MSTGLIQARNFEIHEVPDGYIVYHKEQDRVHYLNKTAAVIFELCNGTKLPQDIVEQVAKIYALDPSAYGEIRASLRFACAGGIGPIVVALTYDVAAGVILGGSPTRDRLRCDQSEPASGERSVSIQVAKRALNKL